MQKVIALLSRQGTACPETALIDDEDTPVARRQVEATLIPDDPDPDAPVPGTWTDVSDNESIL